VTHPRPDHPTPTVLLIHGGLWEDDMDADRFWVRPGVTAALGNAGFSVLAPTRPRRPSTWLDEVEHLAPFLPEHPVPVVAGSNGCSVAARLALAFPDRIDRLLLAWPATARDPRVDALTRTDLCRLGASEPTIDAFLQGDTLRGVTDIELATLTIPTAVLPSTPANPSHQRQTVDALRRLLPDCTELPGCPEPPRPDFAPHLDQFLTSVTGFVRR
jgi:pimeloyl-ACP methyl ester carboxylesterase